MTLIEGQRGKGTEGQRHKGTKKNEKHIEICRSGKNQ
jgi:hypothetical protein